MQNQFENKKKKTEEKNFFTPIMSVFCLAMLSFGIIINTTGYESTLDARVEGHLIQVPSRTTGRITQIYVSSKQEVKKGDLLLEIDSNYYEDRLKRAEIELNSTRAKLNISKKIVDENSQTLNQTYEDTKNAETNFRINKGGYDEFTKSYAYNKKTTSLLEGKSKDCLTADDIKNGEDATSTPDITEISESFKLNPEELTAKIKMLENLIAETKLAISYTKVYAPCDGIISAVDIEENEYVKISQQLFSLIPKRMWITANYKKSQTADMIVGQPVKIKIKNYPKRTFKGVVESIERKGINQNQQDIQIIPVKILFIEDYSEFNLTPGMSVITRVKVK